MLACKQIKYSHNFKNIGKLIYEMHTENNLSVEKITHTITDNASNFSKAFKVLMIQIQIKMCCEKNQIIYLQLGIQKI